MRFDSDGTVMRGTIDRLGVQYIYVEASLTEEVPVTGPSHADRFHFKFMHAANGRGLEFDPILVHARFTNQLRLMKRGEGKVVFAPSHHDPLAEIEVVKPLGAVYIEGDIFASARRIATVEADRFLPYAFQNIDDYSAI